MHAGKERITPGSAALLGVVVSEDCAFVSDTINIGRIANHEAAMVDTRLKNADVIAHDEQDVGLARWPLRARGHSDQGHGSERRQQGEPKSACDTHASHPRV